MYTSTCIIIIYLNERINLETIQYFLLIFYVLNK